jgi:hypothetical protein
MQLPPALFFVIGSDRGAWFNAIDPCTTLDEAADAIGETVKHWGDIPMRVLRVSDSLNTDDCTADAFALIDARMKERAA